VLKGVRNGAKLYVVDPRRTGTAQWADAWLGVNVGSDIALSNAMAHEILALGLENRTFIGRSTTGFEEYRASVAACTPEWAQEVTGVPAEIIRRVAR
jgi:formate dehydrogenase major subunit